MENISHIAVPYAKALFDFALEKDAVEIVYADMQSLNSLCKSNRDFLLMLKSPILKTEKNKRSSLRCLKMQFLISHVGF